MAAVMAVTAIGVDEKHVVRIGVVSVVHDAGSGAVLHCLAGAKAANLGAFVEDIKDHGGAPEQIETVTLDMSRDYSVRVVQYWSRPATCFDPFHLVNLANAAI